MSLDGRAYRVQGERPDGSTVTRDFLAKAKAEAAAERMRRPPRLANVRITRSAPIRWLYADTPGPTGQDT